MISLKWFRENFELLVEKYKGREIDEEILTEIKLLDQKVIKLKAEIDNLRCEKNVLSKKYDSSQTSKLANLKNNLRELESEYKDQQKKINNLIFSLPAIPEDETPFEDKEVLKWGEAKKKENHKSYLELSEELELIDLKASVNCSGAGFSVYKNKGEKLFRALINFTLDWAEKNDFKRYYLPAIVNEESLFCTSQISKFKENLFQLQNLEKYLSPTAEVQLVNLFRGKILSKSELPIKVCSNTNCFRNEKMGAGMETKGIMRLFQFSKTELVMITTPEESEKYLNYLSEIIEGLLKQLEVPYRKVLLSRKELSFSSSKTYDFEVWIGSEGKYREVSSLSNTKDFQSLRGGIRYKENLLDAKEKSKNVHILNGSCLAIDRLFAAIIENHQTEQGDIFFPVCLEKYLDSRVLSKV